jgi:hypothetical protein
MNRQNILTLRFKGNKTELLNWLQAQCDKADLSMNQTVIALIEKYQDELAMNDEYKEMARMDAQDQERKAFYKENPNERI